MFPFPSYLLFENPNRVAENMTLNYCKITYNGIERILKANKSRSSIDHISNFRLSIEGFLVRKGSRFILQVYKRYQIYLCLLLILWKRKNVLLFLSGIFQRSKDNNTSKIMWHWTEGNIPKIIGLFLAFTLEYNSAGHWIQCQNDCYTAILGLPGGWLWVFLKDHSNKLKVGEGSQLLFLAFHSGVIT